MIDPLRALSRVLAPSSAVIKSSSPPEPGSARPLQSVEEDDDELPIDRPNLTLPLYEDDDEVDLRPHRSSMLEGDITTELPRRAYSEMPSRLSLAATRMSDYYNLNEADEPQDLTQGFFPPLGMDDGDLGGLPVDEELEERFDDDDLRRGSMPPRESDFGFDVPLDADPEPSTFMMPLGQSSPQRRPPSAEADEAEAGPLPGYDDWPDLPEQASDTDDEGNEGMPEVDVEADMEVDDDVNGDVEADATATEGHLSIEPKRKRKLKPGWRMSKHGIECPQFPPATVKRVAEQFARTSGIANPRIDKNTLAALQQATDWFYEQVSEDLAAFATHAGRKTINESDMELVMKRRVFPCPPGYLVLYILVTSVQHILTNGVTDSARSPRPAPSSRWQPSTCLRSWCGS
jgi:histone H3/H4